MDFIERIFHLSPDQGNGTLEFTIILVIAAIPVCVALVRVRPKRQPKQLT